MALTRTDFLSFLRTFKYAIQSSVCANGTPQSAVVGIAVSDELEIVFDTLGTSRKAKNLRLNPEIAFVIGSTAEDAQQCAQLEGVADEPDGQERERILALYFSAFPHGKERLAWPDITYFRVKPTWVRFSDFAQDPPLIVELDGENLSQLR